MLDLILVHRKRNGNPLQFSVPIWRTCLREIGFFDSQQFDGLKLSNLADDEVLKGDQALRFLIEVVCGLHSPVLGETEVQGQFKNFLNTEANNPFFPIDLKNHSQEIFRIVKLIRTEHLSQLGCHSYGSWVRQHTRKSRNIGIIGSGNLVEEILPWLKKSNSLKLITRNTDRALKLKSQFSNTVIHSLNEIPSVDCLIVAAPIDNNFLLNQISQQKNLSSLFDFRGEAELVGHYPFQYFSLNKILSDLQLHKKTQENAILKSKETLEQILSSHNRKANFRPGGWEDLCG